MYRYIIVTHIPSFYNVNLYNELANKMNILVVFISSNTLEKRSSDFLTENSAKFQYKILHYGAFQIRDPLHNVLKLITFLRNKKYEKLIVSGWDLIEFWYLVFFNSGSKNCLVLESTIMESNTCGVKGLIKKIFLKRISVVFAPGSLHVELLKKLEYRKIIKLTKGVGIINKPVYTKIKRKYRKNFLFVGRLEAVKNLEILISVFNKLQDCKLTIIGSGSCKFGLEKIANSNIIFKDSIPNLELSSYYLNNDVLLLPSLSEPWGLVVEESLYFGMPVIVSNCCGVCELIKDGHNGYIINPNDANSIINTISKINNESYQMLLKGVEKYSIGHKDECQVSAYR